jgi:hypothetical protein
MSESHYSIGDYFKRNISNEVYFTPGSQAFITLGVSSNIVIGLNTNFRFGYHFQCGASARLELIAEKKFSNVPFLGKAFSQVDEVYTKSLQWICGFRNRRAVDLTMICPELKETIGGWSFFKKAPYALSAGIPKISQWEDFNEESFLQSDATTLYGLPLNVQSTILPWLRVDKDDAVLVPLCIWAAPTLFWVKDGAVQSFAAIKSASKWAWDCIVGKVTPVEGKVTLANNIDPEYRMPASVWGGIFGFQTQQRAELEVQHELSKVEQNFTTCKLAPRCQSFYGEVHHHCASVYSIQAQAMTLNPSEVLFVQANGDDFEISKNLTNFM